MKRVSAVFETFIFTSRWLVVPFLVGLIVGLATLVYKFVLRLAEFVVEVPGTEPSDMIVGILKLVDLALVANLIVIVICSSYENFVLRIDTVKHPHLPAGLVNIDFADLKQRLLARSWQLPPSMCWSGSWT